MQVTVVFGKKSFGEDRASRAPSGLATVQNKHWKSRSEVYNPEWNPDGWEKIVAIPKSDIEVDALACTL